MKPSYLLSTLAILSLTAGCGSTKKAARTEADVPREVTPDARPTEPATAELRDALIMLQRIHFGYDSASIQPSSRAALAAAAAPLRGHPDVHLYVDGHTDVRGESRYNLALGERRARAVVDGLAQLGVARERLHVMTYGESAPLTRGSGPLVFAANRRAEFRLYRGDVRIDLEDGVLYDDRGQPLVHGRTSARESR